MAEEKENKETRKEKPADEKAEKKETGKEQKPEAKKEAEGMAPAKEDERLIVRVADIDLNGKLSVVRALIKIKGIGIRMAKNIAVIFEKETGISGNEKLGKLTPEQIKKLEEVVRNPKDKGVPVWALNRRKDFETGLDSHRVMAELDFGLRTDVQRLGEIKSYRGLRHSWKLPVRGQRTKSTHRGKGSTVGVVRKETEK